MEEIENREASKSKYLLGKMGEGYLFHGSPAPEVIEVLEPRTAKDPTSEWNSDNAVYASTHPAYAAIFALYKGNNTWSVATRSDEKGRIKSLVAKIPKVDRDQTEDSKGRVYVLPPEGFVGRSSNYIQKKSQDAVIPVESVVVGYGDFLELGGVVEWV